MLGKLVGWSDTIVALATPPGIGAIGVIRVSGPGSFAVVNGLFPSKDLNAQLTHTIHVGMLRDGEEALDEVVLSLFRGPRSYTGEDVIEISCHGSPYVQERVIQALLKGGARLAKAGEFTQRAFVNGKLDLAQAEAVADLIASNTSASARTALHTMRGGFSRALRELREKLLSFSALIELELDFSQEDVEFADRRQFYELVTGAETLTGDLLRSFRLGNVIRNGVTVAIVGKPNAGKSTLLNTLLNENRAIVSEIAGTTRDTIEETLNIDGILFRLVDTAGIREHTSDLVERIGVERSLEKMEQADIVVYLFDVGDEVSGVRDFWGAEFAGDRGSGDRVLGDRVLGADVGETDAGAGSFDLGSSGSGSFGEDSSGGADGAAVKLRGGEKRFLWVGNKLDSLLAGAPGVVGAGDIAAGSESSGEIAAEAVSSGKAVAGSGSSGESGVALISTGDLAAAEDIAKRKFAFLPNPIFISAKGRQHIDVLRQRLVDQVLQGNAAGAGAEGTIVTNARHYHALQKVAESLAAIHRGLDESLPGDLMALDIRHCLHYLGEITGEITTEDRLDYIFSKFCIGK